jgi:hypothetical protein
MPPPLKGGGTVIDPAQPREADRLRAHRARLQGHVEIAGGEPLLAAFARHGADHQHFRMRHRVMVGVDPIMRRGEHGAAVGIDQHGADRHLAGRRGLLGLGQGLLHIGEPGVNRF